MTDRILSLLGMCRRAGKLVIGAQPCIDSISKRKSNLIIFANDFSRSSAKPVLEKAHQSDVKTLVLNRSKEEISLALGKLCGVVSVEDNGFAKKLTELINSEQGGE